MAIKPHPKQGEKPVALRGRVAVTPLRRVAIVAVPPVRTLDVFGPAEVFADANHLNRGGPAYDVQVLSATEDRTVASYLGVSLVTDRSYREMRQPVDTLLVAGGEGAQQMRYSPRFLEWLRRQSSKARRYGSVCTGALVLAEAGLKFSVGALARRAAMSPRNFARIFREEIGETPAPHVETLRVEAARRQLETTAAALDEVADICGFGSAEVLRRTFFRKVVTTPGKYRSSFAHQR
jgi:transcriptional regulator GlxA family with amidase domain